MLFLPTDRYDIIETMEVIPVTQDKFAFVDDEDFEMLYRHKWYLIKTVLKSREIYYAVRSIVLQAPLLQQVYFAMHTQIMNTPTGLEIHHRNGNGLDNQKQNLVICTTRQHMIMDGRIKSK